MLITKYLPLFIFCLIVLVACEQSRATFEIVNHTQQTLDAVYITPNRNETAKHISLPPSESSVYEIDMSEAEGDGSYTLYYTLNDKTLFHQFGYYTNGSALEEGTQLNIYQDSVEVVWGERSNY